MLLTYLLTYLLTTVFIRLFDYLFGFLYIEKKVLYKTIFDGIAIRKQQVIFVILIDTTQNILDTLKAKVNFLQRQRHHPRLNSLIRIQENYYILHQLVVLWMIF